MRIEKNRKLVAVSSTGDLTRHDRDADGNIKPYKGYVGGSNYCIEIWKDNKGKWKSNVVSTYQAYQTIREYGEEDGFRRLRNPARSQNGNPLVMRLMINDMIRYKDDGELKTQRVVKISGNGQIFLATHNEANVSERNASKEDAFVFVSKMAGSLQKTQARRVTVDPIGNLRDPGFSVSR